MAHPLTATPTGLDIDTIIDRRLVTMLFQPVIDLASGEVVGFEALARGPSGTPWEGADALFGAATRAGRVAELDWVCRARAIDAALHCGLPRTLTWFINSEPIAYGSAPPPDLVPVLNRSTELRVVMEITERDVANAPGLLLYTCERFRGRACGVALDDVGANPHSLALLPLLGADVVKLDLRLAHEAAGGRTMLVANAVRAYAERTGAAVIAEGIETPEHRDSALLLGARYGQGFWLGRPAPLPGTVPEPSRPFPLRPATVSRTEPVRRTPFHVVNRSRTAQRATKASLVRMSRHLERQALAGGESYLVIGGFQHLYYFSRATRRVYADLTGRQAFVTAIGVDMPVEPEPGVQGIAVPPDDPLTGEWLVIVMGPHFAAALIALELGGPSDNGSADIEAGPWTLHGSAEPGRTAPRAGTPVEARAEGSGTTSGAGVTRTAGTGHGAGAPRPAGIPTPSAAPGEAGTAAADRQRRFAYIITHDRDLVIAAARAAFDRVGVVTG